MHAIYKDFQRNNVNSISVKNWEEVDKIEHRIEKSILDVKPSIEVKFTTLMPVCSPQEVHYNALLEDILTSLRDSLRVGSFLNKV